jgi:uncharacterized protein YgiM (DUF1202 family)
MAAQRFLMSRSIHRFGRLFTCLLFAGLSLGLLAPAGTPLAQAAAFSPGDTVVVDTDLLNFREAPSLDASILGIFNQGDAMTIIGSPVTTDGYTWYPVDAFIKGTMSGWVAGEFLVLGGESGDDGWYGGFELGDVAMIDTPRLNCRTGPGLDYPVDHVMNGGEQVLVMAGPVPADGYHWFRLMMTDGDIAWAIGEGLAPVGDASDPGDGSTFPKGAEVIVNTDLLNLRASAGLSKAVIMTLPYGTNLIVSNGPMAADGYNWFEVETRDGDLGWVAGAFLAYPADSGNNGDWIPYFAVGSSAVVDTPRLNCRTGPGLSYPVDHVMNGGEEVIVLYGPIAADGYHWYQLEMENGDIAWAIGEGLI